MEKALQLNPDVVIVDIGMPNLNGLDTARQLLQHDPHFKVIVLTITDSDQVIREAPDAGACGLFSSRMPRVRPLVFPLFANGVARKHTTVPHGHIRIDLALAFEDSSGSGSGSAIAPVRRFGFGFSGARTGASGSSEDGSISPLNMKIGGLQKS